MFAMTSEQMNTGSVRETCFYNQLMVKHKIRQPKMTDFEIDDKFIFEVGGKTKSQKQIKGLKNAFVAKDNMEFPVGNTIPLWLFGFLY